MNTANQALLRHLTAKMRASTFRLRHHKPPTRTALRLARCGLLVFTIALIASAFYSTSSASSINRFAPGNLNGLTAAATTNTRAALTGGAVPERQGYAPGENYFLAALRRVFPPVPPAFLETIFAPPLQSGPPGPDMVFYAANCSTPKAIFNLGDTVCVTVTSVDPNLNAHVDWVGATGNVQASSSTISAGSLTTSFTIPANGQVGRWRADITSLSDGAPRATGFFTVRDPSNAVADLSVNKLVTRATATAGSDIAFELDVINNGPNDATNVVLTDTVPNDSTFVALTQESGPAFNCTLPAMGGTGAYTCSINSLASGEAAVFKVLYNVNSGTPADTSISGTARISAASPADRFSANDSSTDSAPVHVEPCVVTCPANVTNVPNAQDEFGAFVTLPNASGSGTSCGTLTYNPASGSFFPVGTTLVSVGGDTGNSCSFTVEVKDTQSPTIACPDDYTTFESSAGAGSAVVNYTPPMATDNDPSFSAASVSCDHPSGSTFNVGTTPVTCTATDPAGNSNACSFNVTVQPLATCTFSCPESIVQDSDPDSCGANVSYAATASDACGAVTYTNAKTSAPLPSGSFFPVGTTTVKAAASTGETCFFRVTVRDTKPPSFTCPAPIVVSASATSCEARVNIPTPAVTDNCSGATINSVRDDGRLLTDAYPVGRTTITWTARDKAGLTTSCDQIVTVRDTVPPVVNLVPDVTVSVPADACQVDVPEVLQVSSGGPEGSAPPLGTASDNCKPLNLLTISQSPAAGTRVGPGTYPITVTVYDGDPEDLTNPPNHTTKTMLFKVIDNTPPTISCRSNIIVSLPLNTPSNSMAVSYQPPTGADNCGVTVTQTSGLPSGASFPVGTTTNTFTATDAAGNTASCSFTVTVLYDFTGFFRPVRNPPTFNVVNAGRAIRVKFSLSGNKGLNIFATGSPTSEPLTCNSTDPASDVEETETADDSRLRYAPGSDQYHYVWKTDSSWAGTCRQLVIQLSDGTYHRANFRFRRRSEERE